MRARLNVQGRGRAPSCQRPGSIAAIRLLTGIVARTQFHRPYGTSGHIHSGDPMAFDTVPGSCWPAGAMTTKITPPCRFPSATHGPRHEGMRPHRHDHNRDSGASGLEGCLTIGRRCAHPCLCRTCGPPIAATRLRTSAPRPTATPPAVRSSRLRSTRRLGLVLRRPHQGRLARSDSAGRANSEIRVAL